MLFGHAPRTMHGMLRRVPSLLGPLSVPARSSDSTASFTRGLRIDAGNALALHPARRHRRHGASVTENPPDDAVATDPGSRQSRSMSSAGSGGGHVRTPVGLGQSASVWTPRHVIAS